MGNKIYAVLTGDLVKSSRLSSRRLEEVRRSLMRGADIVKQWKRGLIVGEPDFFRGDAWQILLTSPNMAVRVSVFLRAFVLARGEADTRVAIGLGEVEKISSRRISLSTGQAFMLSGHALDVLTEYSKMSIEMPKSGGPLSDWLPVVAHLSDSLIGQWTRRQAEIVCIAIGPNEPIHEEIARTLKPAVSKQAVTKALNGANWHVVRETIHQFEKTPWNSLLQSKKG